MRLLLERRPRRRSRFQENVPCRAARARLLPPPARATRRAAGMPPRARARAGPRRARRRGCSPSAQAAGPLLLEVRKEATRFSLADRRRRSTDGAGCGSGRFLLLSARLSTLFAGDRDLAGVAALGALREADRQGAVPVRRLRLVGVDAVGQLDLPVEADVALLPGALPRLLDLVLALNGQRVVFHLDLHVVGVEPWQLGGELDRVPGVAHLHARHPHRPAVFLAAP